MNELYPLKFKPQHFEKIWGGQKLKTVLNKDFGNLPNSGESWEVSAVKDNVSVIANGFLKGNTLQELIEIYMADLVGEKTFTKFGEEFPLLIKFIDAQDDLSIQVHPNDKLSAERHKAFGKTEMWYVVQADDGAKLNAGFNQEMDKEKYLEAVNSGKIMDILNFEEVAEGDVFFVPAGRVHAICKGILVAEIQQTSDVTYRIYDFERKDKDGNERELHTELAIDAIDFKKVEAYKTNYTVKNNEPVELASCQYFTTNLLTFDKVIKKDIYSLDSFVIYMCLEGEFTIEYSNGSEVIGKGETVLVPAALNSFQLKPNSGKIKALEVYIKN